MVSIRTTNASKEIPRIEGYSTDWARLSNERIEELIYLSGVSSLDREGIPTRFKSSIIPPDEVKHLIVHGIGSEPYNISLDLLLRDRNLLNFLEGIKILKRIMPNARAHLSINAHKQKLIEQLTKLTSQLEWLDIYPLEPKYPQGYDEMLVPTILHQNFPYGYSAANIGVVILNIQAVLGVYEAVCEGKPFIERIVAICGPSIKDNIHIRVRVGTSLRDILSQRVKTETAVRVVLNSLLTGFQLNDISLPIDRTFSQIIAIPENRQREFLAFTNPGKDKDSYTRASLARIFLWMKKMPDTNEHGEERPCISCGFCEDICPVRIIPHLLARYVQRGLIDETIMNYGIFNCIECGLCSYVCPSKIPLMKIIKDGQDKLTMQGCDSAQCVLPYFNLKGIEEYRGVTKL
jgi:Na(+)-translocating NADH:ubiquinone oxidoreductase A subunit